MLAAPPIIPIADERLSDDHDPYSSSSLSCCSPASACAVAAAAPDAGRTMKAPPAVTVLTGELDLHASRSLGERLSAHVGAGVGGGDLILDLTTVSFIDSSALGALVLAEQRLGRQGRGLAVVAPKGSPAAELIALTHGVGRLSLHPTHEAARAALGGGHEHSA
jgi:anti-sigma B factor antagonist